MGYHKNAPWTAVSRERLARRVIQDGVTVRAAAAELSVSVRTAAKWDGRYRQYGGAGLADSQFAAARSPRQISFSLLEKIVALTGAAPSLTRPRPTAKQSASSRLRCANGLMQNTGPTRRRETSTFGPGTTTTTAKDPILASTTSRPSAVPTPEQPLDLLQAPAN